MVLNEEKLTITFIYVVDTSSEMMGVGIDRVNRTIKEVAHKLMAISIQRKYIAFKIAVLTFSGESATWQTPNPVDAANYKCNLNAEIGKAKISAAFKELDEKLSNNDFMGNTADNCPLAIFLLACHELDDDYEETLKILENNKRFKNALKYTVPIGNDIGKMALKKFNGSIEAVPESIFDSAVLEKFTGGTGIVSEPIFDFDSLYHMVYGMSKHAVKSLTNVDV